MGKADIDVANRGVDRSSRPRRLCYPRGNFSVVPGPHRRGHERALGRGFPSGPHAVKGPVRPAFALALYGGFLTRLSRPLGARVTLSRACRPSRTAHLPLSLACARLDPQAEVGGVSLPPQGLPKEAPHGLPPTLRASTRGSTAGCGEAPRGLLALRGDVGLCTHPVGSRGPRPGQRGPR